MHTPPWLSPLRLPLLVVLFFAVLLLCYGPALRGEFLWDDVTWLTDANAQALLKDTSGLWRMWTNVGALQHYFPVTGTSFWLDHHCWGTWTLPMHVENVLLHGLASVLLGLWLHGQRVRGAWLAAGVFGLHPVMGESVAWITERKNVLSGVLFLLALLAYARFDRTAVKARRRILYVTALLLFTGALLAKSSTVIMPLVLLLAAWWQRGTSTWRRDVLRVLPFCLLAAAAGMLTLWMEKHRVGAVGTPWEHSFVARLGIAGRAVWFYVMKLAWPSPVCAIYPKWEPRTDDVTGWLVLTAALAAMAALWFGRGRIGRGPLVAVTVFIAALFPVLGFFNVYGMSLSFVADRWAYLPGMSLIALATGAASTLAERWQRPWLLHGLAALLLPVLGLLTWKQAARFQSERSLWEATVAVNPMSSLAHYGLAVVHVNAGEEDAAQACFTEALRLDPAYGDAHHDLGALLLRQGNLRQAQPHLRSAVESNPEDAMYHNSMGLALAMANDLGAATSHYQAALDLKPDYVEALGNYGNALVQSGRFAQAVECFERALKLDSKTAELRMNLGVALAQLGRADDCIDALIAALKLKPDYPDALTNLKEMLRRTRRQDELTGILRQIGTPKKTD